MARVKFQLENKGLVILIWYYVAKVGSRQSVLDSNWKDEDVLFSRQIQAEKYVQEGLHMTCENCGTENQEAIVFCGNCGTALAETQLEAETYWADELVVRPSQWAWGVYAVPLVVIYALLMSVDVFTFGLLPVAVLAAFIIPRYITWRGSAYTLTQDSLIIKRGQLGRQDEVPVLFTDISSFEERQGFLGPTLQYTSVHVFLHDGRQGVLSYVPANSGIIEKLLAQGIVEGTPVSTGEDEEGEGDSSV